ncbi:MAGa3780 family membrane protein [Mycoplasmopsis verecunda]|uniref:Uncharacterized protein n=1 Tax=Mycoplasmopsis verecunda TaxID=171291 RepID=A0A1T4L1X4_9BACT|nr:hypothetical protein [Mycoplasmopsis verecunda]WPB54376.1 hypothetical protein SAM46_02710 [Mycoplasmopsis verecunda]SJZ48696.1 hypothetical protein SAMN02745154_00300 [Mycoplasmopsis verecunda]
MKNQVIKKTTFHTWSNLRKATLYAGIAILLLVFITTLWRWGIITHQIQNALSKMTETEKQHMLDNGLNPVILPNFWAITGTFTWISNLAIGIALILFAIYPKSWLAQRGLFLANTYITITFIVFWTLIFPASLKNFHPNLFFNSFVVHFLNPFICMIFVFLNRKNLSITKATIWLSSVVMVAYWFFALLLFFIGEPIYNDFTNGLTNTKNINLYKQMGLVVYDFLNFKQPLFYKGGNIVIVIVLNLVIFVVGFFLTPALGFGWKYGLKIKYDTVTKSWDVR